MKVAKGMKLRAAIVFFIGTASAVAGTIDTSYVLPESLAEWKCQTQSYEKQGHHVTTYAIFSPGRAHVITLAFVDGYADHEIGKTHFATLRRSFAQAGLTDVEEEKNMVMYGLKGAEVTARGVVQNKELRGKGIILKDGGSELTIMLIATGVAFDDVGFTTALSGLGVARQ